MRGWDSRGVCVCIWVVVGVFWERGLVVVGEA
jgi:hypothetical protein